MEEHRSEWAPSVVAIERIDAHPNADALCIYHTSYGDYPVVDKIGAYNVGDKVCMIPIDTIVPDTEQFAFLSPILYEEYEDNGEIKKRVVGRKYEVGNVPEHYRVIKAKRLRGQYSQGMLVPLTDSKLNVGDSIVELFGLKKWEEEEEDNLPSEKEKNKKGFAQNDSAPKGWAIPYYDIPSVRKHADLFLPDEEVVLLAKDNGCNFSACFDGEKLYVKSRNFYKRSIIEYIDSAGIKQSIQSTDQWSESARRYKLKEKLAAFPMKVFFAECVGLVKNFRYDAQIIDGKLLPTLHFFDVYDPVAMRYLDYEESLSMILAAELIPSHEIYRGPWLGKEKMMPLAEGKSSWNDKCILEGWVMKPLKERVQLGVGRWQLKCVSQTYTLSK